MITVHRIADDKGFTQGVTIIVDTAASLKGFIELVQRGANLWPDASSELKEFADLITGTADGKLGDRLQDYKKLANETKGNHDRT